jgi:hypothetical protein
LTHPAGTSTPFPELRQTPTMRVLTAPTTRPTKSALMKRAYPCLLPRIFVNTSLLLSTI